MTKQQFFSRCAYCDEPFDADRHRKHAAHIIPKVRGGCDCPANIVDACEECNKGEGGLGILTPIEWWAEQQWEGETSKDDISAFDAGGWKLVERQQMLLQVAYWEARARWHLLKHHGIKASFRG